MREPILQPSPVSYGLCGYAPDEAPDDACGNPAKYVVIVAGHEDVECALCVEHLALAREEHGDYILQIFLHN